MKKMLLTLFLFSFVLSIYPQESKIWDSVPEKIKSRKYYKRFEWFYRQRATPFDTISTTKLNIEFEKEKAKTSIENKSTLQWLPLGPKGITQTFPSHWGVSSGRCRALDIHPQDPNIAYIGAASGGIWKTTDGGESWQSVSDNFNTISFGAIAIDPNNPEVVYAGTGEACSILSGYTYNGDGLYKTTNGGLTWSKIGAELNVKTHTGDIMVNPVNSNLIYAALTIGSFFIPNPERTGVWRSTDAGQTWQKTLSVPEAYDIECDPTNENIVYAAVGGSNTNSGFYKSTDKGLTWVKNNNGLMSPSGISRMQISLCNDTPNIIYGYIYGSSTKAYKTTNGGTNWVELTSANPLGGYHASMGWYDQGNYDLCISVKPNDPNFVLVGNVELHKTTTGNNFSVFRIPGTSDIWGSPTHVDFHKIVFSKSNPQIVYLVSDGGIFKSLDGGNTWTNKNNGISTIQFYSLASHPTDRNKLIGGAQDNGNFRTLDAGNTNWDFSSTGDGMNCFYDHTNPNTVYFSIQYGSVLKSNNQGNSNSVFSISPNYLSSDNPFWNAPFFMHPTNNNIIYVASTRLWRSTNAGAEWNPISTYFAASINSMDQNRLYPEIMVACADGDFSANPRVYVSTNEGINWSAVDQNIPGVKRFISNVKTDPINRNTVYVVRSGFGSGKIFKSENLGSTWIDISGNLPDIPHNDLFIDPSAPGYLYAANDFGVYQTSDGGINWNRVSNGVPVVPVMDLDYVRYGSTRLLRAGTYGRSAYELELPEANYAFINMVTPLAGENITEGSRIKIRWASNDISKVNIYFSKDNKVSWQLLVNGYAANALEYLWLVPIGIADSCFIKIEDKLNPQIFQITDNAFSIIHLNAPQIVRPLNGIVNYDNEPTIFEWLAISGIDKYSIEIADDSLFSNSVLVDSLVLTSTKEVAGLENNKKYFWKIGVRNELVPYQISNTFNFVTQLSKPELLMPANNSINIPVVTDLSWGNVNGAGLYHLQLSKNIFFSQLVVNDSTLVNNQYHLTGLLTNKIYYWRVRAKGQNGYSKFAQYYKFTTALASAIEDNINGLPTEFVLFNNYPNPFNPETAISFGIPGSGSIKLTIYDGLGKEIKVLKNIYSQAGYYQMVWDGKSSSTMPAASGIYFYRLEANLDAGGNKPIFKIGKMILSK
ncbi:MAG: T9SS type A sorting domain-containing protein [bacterium]